MGPKYRKKPEEKPEGTDLELDRPDPEEEGPLLELDRDNMEASFVFQDVRRKLRLVLSEVNHILKLQLMTWWRWT